MGRSGGSGGRSSGGSFGGSRSSGGRTGGSSSGRSGGSFGGSSFGRSGGTLGGSSSGRAGSTLGGSSSGKAGSSFGGSSSGRSGSPFGGSSFGGGSFGSPGGSFGGSHNKGVFGSGRKSGSSFGIPGGIHMGGRPRNSYVGGIPSGGGSGGCTARGCLMTIIVFFIFILVITAAAIFIQLASNGSSNDILASSIEREPLPKGSVNETGYFTDELGWIRNKTKLENGLKYFYDKTGVQPYLYIIDNIDGNHYPSENEMDSYANNLYEELFTDEAHLLLVFFEYDSRYMDWYVAGTQAKSVIDNEAADILLDYIDRYYYDNNLTDEEFFSKSFMDAADRMMTVTRSPWIDVLIVISFVILVLILFSWWKKAKKQKNLEAKQMEDILNTPLDRFGDTEAEELASKYEDIDIDN